MAKYDSIKGIGTALITPFSSGLIDEKSLTELVELNILNGIDFLVPLGTTGETSTLSDDECRQVMDLVKISNAGRLPIVCGWFGKNNTALILDMIKNFDFDGVDAILCASPYYNKPSQEGIFKHYISIADASPVPVILYNVPSRTGSNVSAEITLRLAEHQNIIATKEACGDLNQIMQILKYKPHDFNVLSGDDTLALPMIACGATGLISVISNAFPAEFSSMVHAALAHDFNKAKKINDTLLDLHKWLYIEGNPVGVKAAMDIIGYCTDEVRLPLTGLSKGARKGLVEVMQTFVI